MVTEFSSTARFLSALGEPTDVPGRSPDRGPPYWKSTVLRQRRSATPLSASRQHPGRVNPICSSFTKALPDLSGRFRIIQMDRQKDIKIAELIIKGDLPVRHEPRRQAAGGSSSSPPAPSARPRGNG
ncbi:hypothetical protein WME97_29815 [Sorangium sp. So ce367]|uniref:hypothetical protein n=1 Tax=Sorangium sp. So ce367 TaxID=3133305 RepID=UPI003F60AFAA